MISMESYSLEKDPMREVRGFVKDGFVLGFALKSDSGRQRHWGHASAASLAPCSDTPEA